MAGTCCPYVPPPSITAEVREEAKVTLFASPFTGTLDVDVPVSVFGRISSVPVEAAWPNHVPTTFSSAIVAPDAIVTVLDWPAVIPEEPLGTKLISYSIGTAEVLVMQTSDS